MYLYLYRTFFTFFALPLFYSFSFFLLKELHILLIDLTNKYTFCHSFYSLIYAGYHIQPTGLRGEEYVLLPPFVLSRNITSCMLNDCFSYNDRFFGIQHYIFSFIVTSFYFIKLIVIAHNIMWPNWISLSFAIHTLYQT